MKSEIGSLLTKISAIINFVISGLVILFGVVSLLGITFYAGLPGILMIVFVIFGLLWLGLGYLLWLSAKKMENPQTTRQGAIWAIVLGIIMIMNVSGILALIGGILGINDANK